MNDELDALRSQARALEPSARERQLLAGKILKYGDAFLETLSEKKAFVKPNETGPPPAFSEGPTDLNSLLNHLKNHVDAAGLNPASDKHMGYIPGGGLYPSALADFLAAVTNRYAGVFFSSPGAVKMENQCLRWLCDLIGYDEKAGGNLTSGGSMANLIALVNARDHSGISSQDFHKAVIYTTRQVHHCVIKAINFAGLREAKLHVIPMDSRFRMKPGVLKRQVKQDRKEGLRPLVIFASAGTTDIGAVDPLDDIAEIADGQDIWFHVDAAYGGAFLLTEHGQQKMKGIKHADSVTIDPHKGLFLPYGSGALLVKDVAKLYDSQHMTANYLQDTIAADQEYSPADLSPELSKHFRGLRFWLPLQLFGVAPFRAALDEKLLLARYFYKEIQKIEGMEVGPEPELSVLFFRYVPESGDPNAFNKKVLERIHADGRIFLSSTTINDTFYIRLAVLNFRTHRQAIDQTISLLREAINALNVD